MQGATFSASRLAGGDYDVCHARGRRRTRRKGARVLTRLCSRPPPTKNNGIHHRSCRRPQDASCAEWCGTGIGHLQHGVLGMGMEPTVRAPCWLQPPAKKGIAIHFCFSPSHSCLVSLPLGASAGCTRTHTTVFASAINKTNNGIHHRSCRRPQDI